MSLKAGKNHSPNAKTSGHEAKLRQGKPGTTFWWNEKKPDGGRVDQSPTRSEVGAHAPTIGPRSA